MSAVVTVMNMKGGVGKTTVTLNLAGLLARYNIGGRPPLRVLMIDYDPQFNLSQAYIPPKEYFALEKNYKTTLAILIDSGTALNPYQLQVSGNHSPPSVSSLVTNLFTHHTGAKLDIVPSTLNLMYVALGQATTNTKPIEERFEKFIGECRLHYDLIMIDCHPAGSLFTKTSLTNSDFALIPVVPQKYAVRGIGLMMEFMKAKKAGTKAPEPLILFNSTGRTGTSSEEATIRADGKYAPYCLASTLKWYKAFGEPEGGSGFVWQSTKPYSTSAFLNLSAVAREFRTKIAL
ncbi:chromosome partitioning protein [Angulomicrobium tetraedrale]|uniref:Chromosome partitioning protein n=1 Tax=Ancylobacter tetraedralis TaxID=217068 RepID=A0A839ZF34_9HYPH|nr:ParA family protein [Ancylobacter tetraedralis]MBB3773308.1 chromosome partitioning protein [Ancylobacter tetraedralis]